jgi:hypothetical protein
MPLRRMSDTLSWFTARPKLRCNKHEAVLCPAGHTLNDSVWRCPKESTRNATRIAAADYDAANIFVYSCLSGCLCKILQQGVQAEGRAR